MPNPGEELSSLAFDKIIGGTLDAVVKAQSNASLTTVNFIKSTGFKLNEKGEAVEPIYVSFKYPREVSPYLPAVKAAKKIVVVDGGNGYADDNVVGVKIGGADVAAKVSINGGKVTAVTLNGETESEGVVTVVLKSNDGVTGCELRLDKIAAKPAVAAGYQDMELKVPMLTMLPIPFIRIASTDIELNVKINSISSSSSESKDDDTKSGGGEVGYKGFGASVSVNFNASISHQKKSSSTEEVKKEYSLNIKVHAVQDDMPVGISRILDILEEIVVPHYAA